MKLEFHCDSSPNDLLLFIDDIRRVGASGMVVADDPRIALKLSGSGTKDACPSEGRRIGPSDPLPRKTGIAMPTEVVLVDSPDLFQENQSLLVRRDEAIAFAGREVRLAAVTFLRDGGRLIGRPWTDSRNFARRS